MCEEDEARTHAVIKRSWQPLPAAIQDHGRTALDIVMLVAAAAASDLCRCLCLAGKPYTTRDEQEDHRTGSGTVATGHSICDDEHFTGAPAMQNTWRLCGWCS